MKYFILIIVFFSCKNVPGNVIRQSASHDSVSKAFKSDTATPDLHNPYQTGKDTGILNEAMKKIFRFPEVQNLDQQIRKNSKGKHGVSIMVQDEFDNKNSYYDFAVGDESNDVSFVTMFHFILDKRTGQIKAFDSMSDSIMSLKAWRKLRQ